MKVHSTLPKIWPCLLGYAIAVLIPESIGNGVFIFTPTNDLSGPFMGCEAVGPPNHDARQAPWTARKRRARPAHRDVPAIDLKTAVCDPTHVLNQGEWMAANDQMRSALRTDPNVQSYENVRFCEGHTCVWLQNSSNNEFTIDDKLFNDMIAAEEAKCGGPRVALPVVFWVVLGPGHSGC